MRDLERKWSISTGLARQDLIRECGGWRLSISQCEDERTSFRPRVFRPLAWINAFVSRGAHISAGARGWDLRYGGNDIAASQRSSQYRKSRRKRFQIEPACTRRPFE